MVKVTHILTFKMFIKTSKLQRVKLCDGVIFLMKLSFLYQSLFIAVTRRYMKS